MSVALRAVAPAGSLNGTPERMVIGSGSFTIGAAGAITAQDGTKLSGGFVTKTGGQTGRYDVLLSGTCARLTAFASMVGPTTAAFTNANITQVRNVLPTSTVSNFEIQGILGSTSADTDFTSGTIINWVAFGYAK